MKKRYAIYAVWLVLAGLLYFFENNTGTRIVLLGTLLLPAVHRGLFRRQDTDGRRQSTRETVRPLSGQEEEDPGNVRGYLPGDPVNRIHWKLSAKRDELLVREQAPAGSAEEAEKIISTGEKTGFRGSRKKVFAAFAAAFALILVLLFLIPSARRGLEVLLNRLFEASEAVNAYAYERFPVPQGQSAALAVSLLIAGLIALTGIILLADSRIPAFCVMAAFVLFQAYFGLAFPAWGNVMLFVLFALRMMKSPVKKQEVLFLLAGMLAVSVAVAGIWPGVDPATEAASEEVRDLLSRMAQTLGGTVPEMPEGENETRHVYTQSLTGGEQEARRDREYRLVSRKVEMISKPYWVDYLRIMLLLLLTVLLVVVPFLPFAVLNRRRQKALEARKVFQSEEVSRAIEAMFQQVIAWLEATGHGEGNLPYAQWKADIVPGYSGRYLQCEKLFEEARYSTHGMQEEQRRQVMELLEETERVLQQNAGWKQRLRLKYKEFLWV